MSGWSDALDAQTALIRATHTQSYQNYLDDWVEVHRQIWVSPHVKGPDDKPLVTKARAFEFVR